MVLRPFFGWSVFVRLLFALHRVAHKVIEHVDGLRADQLGVQLELAVEGALKPVLQLVGQFQLSGRPVGFEFEIVVCTQTHLVPGALILHLLVGLEVARVVPASRSEGLGGAKVEGVEFLQLATAAQLHRLRRI